MSVSGARLPLSPVPVQVLSGECRSKANLAFNIKFSGSAYKEKQIHLAKKMPIYLTIITQTIPSDQKRREIKKIKLKRKPKRRHVIRISYDPALP